MYPVGCWFDGKIVSDIELRSVETHLGEARQPSLANTNSRVPKIIYIFLLPLLI